MKPFQKLRALRAFAVLIFISLPAHAILDLNTNGMSDLWEKQHNNGNLYPATFLPTADPDQDGWDNATEAVAGTDPYDAQSVIGKVNLQIAPTSVPATFALSWPTKVGKNYQIQTSSDLLDWTDLDNPMHTSDGILTVGVTAIDTSNNQAAKLFWRVVISERDEDGDGLSDYEESLIGSSSTSADTDGDGKFDMDEFIAGTSVTDANSDDTTQTNDPDDPDEPITTQVNEFYFTTEVITVTGLFSYDKKEERGLLEDENTTDIYHTDSMGEESAHEISQEEEPFSFNDLKEKLSELEFTQTASQANNQSTSSVAKVTSDWSAASYTTREENEIVSEAQNVYGTLRKARCVLHVPPRSFAQTYRILKIKRTLSNYYENFNEPPLEAKSFSVLEVTVAANQSAAEIMLDPEADCEIVEGGQYEMVEESLHILAAAVDANRDGHISFAGDDETTSAEPLRFWINDDKDLGHTVDDSDWEEDDVPEKMADDRSTDMIDCKRDLEDFLLFKINTASIHGLIGSGTKDCQLKIRINGTGGTPSVHLYPSLWDDIRYLTDESAATGQLAGVYGNSMMSVNSTAQMISDDIWSHASTTSSTLNGGHNLRMLLEGSEVGEGEIIVEIHYEGSKVAEFAPIHIDLRKAEDLYQTWSCGEVIPAGVDYSAGTWPSATATKIKGASAPPPVTAEQKDLILFVHGWNMWPTDKPDFANTMFKRLWHAGYKGSFASFQWPTFWWSKAHGGNIPGMNLPNPHNFNGSELRAWNSAHALKELVKTLVPQYSIGGKSKIKLYAHSMGNIVAGEALRLLKEEGNHNSVSHYVAAQAAISAHAYDSTTTSRGKDMNKDPDVYGYYWQPGCTSPPHKWRAEGRPCYFARIRMPKGARYISHHNMDDYALEIWHYNNDAKPSTYYDYNREKPVTSFFHDAGTRRLLTMPNDRYEIFSWAAEADSSALGAEPGTAGVFTLKLDLMAAPYNLDSSPKSHSAQFRSYIQKRWDYWHETIKQLDITPSLKKP